MSLEVAQKLVYLRTEWDVFLLSWIVRSHSPLPGFDTT